MSKGKKQAVIGRPHLQLKNVAHRPASTEEAELTKRASHVDKGALPPHTTKANCQLRTSGCAAVADVTPSCSRASRLRCQKTSQALPLYPLSVQSAPVSSIGHFPAAACSLARFVRVVNRMPQTSLFLNRFRLQRYVLVKKGATMRATTLILFHFPFRLPSLYSSLQT